MGIPRQLAGQAFRTRFLIVSNNKKSSNNQFTQSGVEGQSLMQFHLRFLILKLPSSKINQNNIARFAFFSLRFLRLSFKNFNGKYHEFGRVEVKY